VEDLGRDSGCSRCVQLNASGHVDGILEIEIESFAVNASSRGEDYWGCVSVVGCHDRADCEISVLVLDVNLCVDCHPQEVAW
jgi:hypothetical protein